MADELVHQEQRCCLTVCPEPGARWLWGAGRSAPTRLRFCLYHADRYERLGYARTKEELEEKLAERARLNRPGRQMELDERVSKSRRVTKFIVV